MITYRKVLAPHDINGNPRRGWIIQVPGGEVFISEGYGGNSNLYHWLAGGDSVECWEFGREIWYHHTHEAAFENIGVARYRALKKSEGIVF